MYWRKKAGARHSVPSLIPASFLDSGHNSGLFLDSGLSVSSSSVSLLLSPGSSSSLFLLCPVFCLQFSRFSSYLMLSLGSNNTKTYQIVKLILSLVGGRVHGIMVEYRKSLIEKVTQVFLGEKRIKLLKISLVFYFLFLVKVQNNFFELNTNCFNFK